MKLSGVQGTPNSGRAQATASTLVQKCGPGHPRRGHAERSLKEGLKSGKASHYRRVKPPDRFRSGALKPGLHAEVMLGCTVGQCMCRPRPAVSDNQPRTQPPPDFHVTAPLWNG